MSHRVVITLGPSFEPIDGARRLTNFSTGSLGAQLAEACVRAGHSVIAYRGVGATAPFPSIDIPPIPFTTNANLIEKLKAHSCPQAVDAVFHVAALCDYVVDSVEDGAGETLRQNKIATSGGELWMRLKPAPKVFAHLRNIFPCARVCGWKYELNGNREAALQNGWNQLRRYDSSACVVNGAAYGTGFGVLNPQDQTVVAFEDAQGLTEWLANDWILQNGTSGEGQSAAPVT